MSDNSPKPSRFLELAGLVIAVIGALMLIGGIGTWTMVQTELAAEQITVTEDAATNAGKVVNGPFTAYSQAEVINEHSLKASGGKTYAQLDL